MHLRMLLAPTNSTFRLVLPVLKCSAAPPSSLKEAKGSINPSGKSARNDYLELLKSILPDSYSHKSLTHPCAIAQSSERALFAHSRTARLITVDDIAALLLMHEQCGFESNL